MTQHMLLKRYQNFSVENAFRLFSTSNRAKLNLPYWASISSSKCWTSWHTIKNTGWCCESINTFHRFQLANWKSCLKNLPHPVKQLQIICCSHSPYVQDLYYIFSITFTYFITCLPTTNPYMVTYTTLHILPWILIGHSSSFHPRTRDVSTLCSHNPSYHLASCSFEPTNRYPSTVIPTLLPFFIFFPAKDWPLRIFRFIFFNLPYPFLFDSI